VEPGFSLTGENWADVVEICRLVGGMPLGILLASAWVDMLSPAEIARQIKVSLDFLQADWQGVPERQHSMRAVFDHSWQLLTDAERVVLKALSVFRGSFALEAAQAVAGATLHDLRKLVAKSLVQPAAAPPAGGRASEILGGRYELHELLRESWPDHHTRKMWYGIGTQSTSPLPWSDGA